MGIEICHGCVHSWLAAIPEESQHATGAAVVCQELEGRPVEKELLAGQGIAEGVFAGRFN
jgi:hypothetical protein